jgi:putative oxygen-independent coproporphyrinogen III oxidase
MCLATQTSEDPGFGLYVHWPFCLSKCPYCDFNSHVGGEIDHARWQLALLSELDHFADEIGTRPLTSIFFGGGTPSLMAPATAAAVIEHAEERFGLDPEIEITLEANPTSVEARRLAGFRAAGVNRVSLGVQALDDAALAFLGRGHSAKEALAAVQLAARLFPRVSFDLIYARPGQSVAAWLAELDRALDHAGGHLSLYQLTIEPGTRFAALETQDALAVPDGDLAADLYEATQERLAAAGLPAYEISNHARPGEECRHNLTYWRAGDWVGIGPGAHGRLTLDGRRVGTETARMPRAWLENVERAGHAERPREQIPPRQQVEELLLMGLRLIQGVPLRRIEEMSGRPLEEAVQGAALQDLRAAGLIEIQGGRLLAREAGRQRLNGVLLALIIEAQPAAA